MALILIQRIMLLLRESSQKMQLEFLILRKENRFTAEQMSNKHFVTTPVKGKGGNIATWWAVCLIWKRINYFSIAEEGVQDIHSTVRNARKSHLCFWCRMCDWYLPTATFRMEQKAWNDIHLLKMLMIMKDFCWKIRLITAELRFLTHWTISGMELQQGIKLLNSSQFRSRVNTHPVGLAQCHQNIRSGRK